MTTVRGWVAFYVDAHNRLLLHSAFRGQTPDEMYFGTGDVAADLTARAGAARRTRVEANSRQILEVISRNARSRICAQASWTTPR